MSTRRHGPNTPEANLYLLNKLKAIAEEQTPKEKTPTNWDGFKSNFEWVKTGVQNILKF